MPSTPQPSAHPSTASTRSAYLVVALGFLAVVSEGYDLIVYGSAVPALLAHPGWDLTPARVGAIGSLALLGMFVGAPASGWLSDRYGRRKLFIGLLVWFSVMMILVAVAPTPAWLGLFRFLAGLGFGGIPPTAIALVIEFAPPRRRVLSNALMLSGFGIGGVLAAVLSIGLLDDIGFRGLFALGALPLVTLVPLAIWLLPESPSFRASASPSQTPAAAGREEAVKPLASILTGRAALATALFAVANFFGFMLVFGLNTWLPALMRGAGYPLGSSLQFLLVLNLGSIVGGLFGAWLADRIGAREVATSLFVLAAISLALLATFNSSFALTQLLVFLCGMSAVGVQAILWGYVATSYPPRSRATALGVTSGIGRLGAATGPILGGLLVSAGVGLTGNVTVFATAAVLGGLATLLVPATTSHRPGRREPPAHPDRLARPTPPAPTDEVAAPAARQGRA